MIKKLRIKVVVLAMSSLFVLLFVIVAGINILNYNSVVEEADMVLGLLSQNRGSFSGFEKPVEGGMPPMNLPSELSPETPYESRYFSAFLDDEGSVVTVETSKIASVDSERVVEYVKEAISKELRRGFIEDYRYVITKEWSGYRITFLDCGRKLEAFYRFLIISIGMSLAGFGVVFVIISFLSDRMIRPIAESYEKQKRFITDAGHEIKTPLTIINANVDILEMELEEKNESLEDIKLQTRRLRELTEDLVMLSRMEESEQSLIKIEFPISEVVEESLQGFQVFGKQQEKNLVCQIEKNLSMDGDEKAVRQLVSILLDNAMKYSPMGEDIFVSLSKGKSGLTLSVANKTIQPMDKAQADRVFDRFYRTDSSRNSLTGGHGIGLSIAKAIVVAHGGKISARVKNGDVFEVVVSL